MIMYWYGLIVCSIFRGCGMKSLTVIASMMVHRIDPEAAVRLMLAELPSGIVHDRRLMREAQVNLAIRWFAGYALHEKLPDHSSLTRIRQRWGPERFKAVLSRTVKACLAARIATGEVVHIDATLIRANVSWDAIVEAHADAVLTELHSTSAASPKVATTGKTQRNSRPYGSRCLARKGGAFASGRAGLQAANGGRRQTRRDSRRRSDHRRCS